MGVNFGVMTPPGVWVGAWVPNFWNLHSSGTKLISQPGKAMEAMVSTSTRVQGNQAGKIHSLHILHAPRGGGYQPWSNFIGFVPSLSLKLRFVLWSTRLLQHQTIHVFEVV